MKSYVETREGWWLNLKRMVVLTAFTVTIVLSLLILIPAFLFGYMVYSELALSMDAFLLSVWVFIVLFIISLAWVFIYTNREQLVIYRGKEDHVDVIISSIEDSLKESDVQYDHLNVLATGKHQQFKLIDLDCILNVIKKSDKIKPFAIQISFVPVSHKNQREVDSLKHRIQNIMKKKDFRIYRNYKGLTQYYDSF